MSQTIELSLRCVPDHRIDAAAINLAALGPLNDNDVARLPINESCLGDWFDIRRMDSSQPTLRLVGDLSRFDRIGATHASGRLEVVGNVGDHAFAGMSGGEAFVDGNAGKHVGSPFGNDRVGMTGGRVVIRHNVGSRCGHRMRRGHVWIGGDAADGLASFMIAGTIVVAGDIQSDLLGYGMNRGTVILECDPGKIPQAFTRPGLIRSPAVTMMTNFIASKAEQVAPIVGLAKRFTDTAAVCRGDTTVNGQGELWSPVSSR